MNKNYRWGVVAIGAVALGLVALWVARKGHPSDLAFVPVVHKTEVAPATSPSGEEPPAKASVAEPKAKESIHNTAAVATPQPLPTTNVASQPTPPAAAPVASAPPTQPVTATPAPPQAIEATPEVVATHRMYAAHAPLRTPEVADPDSAANRAILQTMVTKAISTIQKMSSPKQ